MTVTNGSLTEETTAGQVSGQVGGASHPASQTLGHVIGWVAAAFGLVAVGIGVWGFWTLLHGRSPGFRWGQSGKGPLMSPGAQWFGAAMFLVIGMVFVVVGVLFGVGAIKSSSCTNCGY
jgi:hypothetical protein